MKFYKKNYNLEKYIDTVFSVVNMAKKDTNLDKVNGTAGCLFDEAGKLFVYNTVFNSEKQIDAINKASYASSPSGNKDFNDAITKYILEDKINNNYTTIATIGGTGAIYLATKLCLTEGDSLIYPEISWGNYKVFTQENNYISKQYNVYDLDSLFNIIDKCEEKAFVIINSPCENPLGHSYTYDEWEKIIDKVNGCNKEIILLVDNAYMDYAYDNSKKFFDLFNHINDNVLVFIVASCSKSFSYYGVRLGALIAINNDADFILQFNNLASRLARTTWSNASNGAMLTIADVLNNHYEEYIKERDVSVQMLKKRTDLFISQAIENGLELYPYNEGFFVTLKIENLAKRDEIHEKLINKHIYTIKVNKGIRIALCSIPLNKVDGLAKKIKEVY